MNVPVFRYKPHLSFLSSLRSLPPLSHLSSPLLLYLPSRWLTGTPLRKSQLTMVHLQLHFPRLLLIQSRHSCLHEVYARLIRALPVIAVRETHLSSTLTRVFSTAGSLCCLSILTGSSSLGKRSFVGPWYVLREHEAGITVADCPLGVLFHRSLRLVTCIDRDVSPGTVHMSTCL